MNKFVKNSVLIILPANNFNEQEYLSVKNSLINAGYQIFIASDASLMSKGENGILVKADVNFFNMKEASFAGVVFIGGAGVVDYFNNISLMNIARKFNKAGKLVAAICGAPIILVNSGVLDEKNASCYPDLKEVMTNRNINYFSDQVVIDNNIITAPDPSSALEFGQAIVEKLKNS